MSLRPSETHAPLAFRRGAPNSVEARLFAHLQFLRDTAGNPGKQPMQSPSTIEWRKRQRRGPSPLFEEVVCAFKRPGLMHFKCEEALKVLEGKEFTEWEELVEELHLPNVIDPKGATTPTEPEDRFYVWCSELEDNAVGGQESQQLPGPSKRWHIPMNMGELLWQDTNYPKIHHIHRVWLSIAIQQYQANPRGDWRSSVESLRFCMQYYKPMPDMFKSNRYMPTWINPEIVNAIFECRPGCSTDV